MSVEKLMVLVRGWEWTKRDSTPANAESKLKALEAAITEIIRERDEAVAEAKSEVAELQLHCACEFEERIEMLTKEHYMFPRVVCLIHARLTADRDEWKKRAEEAEAAALKSWRYFSDEDVHCHHCQVQHFQIENFPHKPDCIITRLSSEGVNG